MGGQVRIPKESAGLEAGGVVVNVRDGVNAVRISFDPGMNAIVLEPNPALGVGQHPTYSLGDFATSTTEAAVADEGPEEVMPDDPWAGRSTGMRCRTCTFYVEKAPSGPSHPDDPIKGRCRRHAPTMSGYPVVFTTDWCGDHRLK